MKALRLTIVVCVTAFVCVLYLYVFKNQKLYETYRCLSGASPWYSCYLKTDYDFRTDLFGITYEGNIKNLVDREILRYGAYEKQVLYFLRDTMQSVSSGGGVFVDIGANTGQHSMFMARYAKQVHAFEPYEPVLEMFRRMVKINDIPNIVIHPVGLGSERATKTFYKPPETNLGSGSFIEGYNQENTKSEKLEIAVGDEELEKAAVERVDLVKIDVEGYEKFVLQGLVRTLSTRRPVVAFEVSVDPQNPDFFKSIEDIRKVFPENYEFLAFDMKNFDPYTGLYQLVELAPDLRFDIPGYYEFVAYPIEKRNQIPRRNLR